MHLIYTVMRFFPWWALPMAFVIGELGVFFRRRASRAQFACFGVAGMLVLCALAWIFLRGDLHSDRWVSAVFGGV